jgi:hypothetical protein
VALSQSVDWPLVHQRYDVCQRDWNGQWRERGRRLLSNGVVVFSEIGDLEYYFVCSFGGYVYASPDYAGLGYSYASENLSPQIFRSESAREFYVRLRPYKSNYGALYAETDQHAEPIR